MSKRLPYQANLRQLRIQAKELHKAYRRSSLDAISRIRKSLTRASGASDTEAVSADFGLQEMQNVIAREYGLEDWGDLRNAVDESHKDTLEHAFQAVRNQDVSNLEELLSDQPDLINQRSEPNSNTLLHVASSNPDVGIVECLLSAGADINARAGEGWTPLHNAESASIAEVLLQGGADVAIEACGSGGTPLAHALFNGNREIAEAIARNTIIPLNLRCASGLGNVELIESFFGPEGNLNPAAGMARGFYRHHAEYPVWTSTDDPGEILDEALVYACLNGRIEAVGLLIDHGADVNGLPYNATGLHFAVQIGDSELVNALIDWGADPTIRDTMHGGSPYDWSLHLNKQEIRGRLLEVVAKTDLSAAVQLGDLTHIRSLMQTEPRQKLTSAYRKAVRVNNKEAAEILLEGGANPTLFDLIELGQRDQVEQFLESGVSPELIRSVRVEVMGKGMQEVEQTALQSAAVSGEAAIGNILADRGAEVDFHGAAFLDRADVVARYVREGTSVDLEDRFGMTPLHRALQGNAVSVIRFLIENGADVSKPADSFSHGPRALHVAAGSGVDSVIFDLLMQAGGDINFDSNQGTPLSLAIKNGRETTANALRERGAQ